MGAGHTPAPPCRCQECLSSIKWQRQLTELSPKTCHWTENNVAFSLEPRAVCAHSLTVVALGVTQLEVSTPGLPLGRLGRPAGGLGRSEEGKRPRAT